MVCSGPPPGHARWSVRLITAEAKKRKLIKRVGRETIRVQQTEIEIAYLPGNVRGGASGGSEDVASRS